MYLHNNFSFDMTTYRLNNGGLYLHCYVHHISSESIMVIGLNTWPYRHRQDPKCTSSDLEISLQTRLYRHSISSDSVIVISLETQFMYLHNNSFHNKLVMPAIYKLEKVMAVIYKLKRIMAGLKEIMAMVDTRFS